MTARRPIVLTSGNLRQIASGDTLTLNAGVTGGAPLNVPQGSAPTSPADGDFWTTSSGAFIRIGGATVGPLGAGGTPGGSSGQIQYNNAGVLGGFTASGDATINTATGAVAVTKTGGVSFGYFATGTDAANLTGTLSIARIANSSVTLAKLANIADATLLGNNTGGAAAPVALTAAQARTLLALGQVTVSTSAPSSPAAGDLWWKSDEGRLKIYYTDTDTSQWVDAFPAVPGPTGATGATGATGSTGATGATGATGGDFIKIADVTTSGAQTSVTFSSIPGTYKHLRIVGAGRSATSGGNFLIQFNGDTTSAHYNSQQLQGNSSTASAAANPAANNYAFDLAASTSTANACGTFELTIPMYASTTFIKAYHCIAGLPYFPIVKIVAGQWNATTAVSQVTFVGSSGQAFANGSVFTLYGLN